MYWPTAVPVVLALTLGGCGAIGAIGVPFKRDAGRNTLSAPTEPVQTGELPPLSGTASDADARNPYPDQFAGGQAGQPGTADFPGDPTMRGSNGQTMVAGAPPVGSGGTVKRTDLLGGWTVAVQSDSCQLFMTLTSWTGGYRASTRGCNSETLQGISAWTLSGNQVVLAGQNGVTIARLFPSGNNRFDGQTEKNPEPIAVFR